MAASKGDDGDRDAAIGQLADRLLSADRAVAFTGAGASTESGIPDFRGEEGLWTRHPAEDLHIARFREDPGAFWGTWLALHDAVTSREPEPNAAHRVLADMVRAGRLDAIVTQNGDGLHQAAGTPDDAVVELHGTFRRGVCMGCGATEPMADIVARLGDGEAPPACTACGGTLKPGAVLFGEALPVEALERARDLALACDLFLVVGSSLVVHPAAGLPRIAKEAGAALAIVNLEATPMHGMADVAIEGKAGAVLSALAEAVDDAASPR